ncbi:MAG: hypothetical protein GY862_02890 [Gammaproteobacteria bacterium]|nr:hypothetical protein [Gammaproteobacteria bacterium]
MYVFAEVQMHTDSGLLRFTSQESVEAMGRSAASHDWTAKMLSSAYDSARALWAVHNGGG